MHSSPTLFGCLAPHQVWTRGLVTSRSYNTSFGSVTQAVDIGRVGVRSKLDLCFLNQLARKKTGYDTMTGYETIRACASSDVHDTVANSRCLRYGSFGSGSAIVQCHLTKVRGTFLSHRHNFISLFAHWGVGISLVFRSCLFMLCAFYLGARVIPLSGFSFRTNSSVVQC